MTMETRCSKVIFPNYSKKKPAEDTLVPSLWGTREKKAIYFFEMSVLFETGELNTYVYDSGDGNTSRTEGKGRTTTITLAD